MSKFSAWELQLLVDNDLPPEAEAPGQPISAERSLQPAWGLSMLLEGQAGRVLFDVGWDGDLLLENAEALGVGLERGVDAIVLSHDHWDHVGGLPRILRELPPVPKVVVPGGFSRRQGAEIAQRVGELVVAREPTEVLPGLITTGTLTSDDQPPEHGLVLARQDEGGAALLTGCAHPGVEPLLEAAAAVAEERGLGPLRALLGGLHGHDDAALLEPLELVVLAHCTAKKVALAEASPRTTLAAVGQRYRL